MSWPSVTMPDPLARPRRSLLRAIALSAGGLALDVWGGNRPAGSASQPARDVSARFAEYAAADEPNADPATVG
jgi:hypothetical protein